MLQHLWLAIHNSELFFGRDEELSLACTYLKSFINVPLIFCGEHGCGKTSLLAKAATEVRAWVQQAGSGVEPVLVLRFLGTSPDSSSIAPLLISVCEQIALNYSPLLKQQCPTEVSKLFQHFKRMTTLATRDKPLVST